MKKTTKKRTNWKQRFLNAEDELVRSAEKLLKTQQRLGEGLLYWQDRYKQCEQECKRRGKELMEIALTANCQLGQTALTSVEALKRHAESTESHNASLLDERQRLAKQVALHIDGSREKISSHWRRFIERLGVVNT